MSPNRPLSLGYSHHTFLYIYHLHQSKLRVSPPYHSSWFNHTYNITCMESTNYETLHYVKQLVYKIGKFKETDFNNHCTRLLLFHKFLNGLTNFAWLVQTLSSDHVSIIVQMFPHQVQLLYCHNFVFPIRYWYLLHNMYHAYKNRTLFTELGGGTFFTPKIMNRTPDPRLR
jgi:hypothetical protein